MTTAISAQQLELAEQIADIPAVQDGLISIRADWYAPGQTGVTIDGVEDPDRCDSMVELIRELAAYAEE